MKKVRVVLTRDYRGLGNIGDIIEVRRGFARNFLIPRNIAIEEINAGKYKKIAEQIKTARQEAIEKASKLATILQGKELTFVRKSGEGGKLFGSVTASDIHSALAEQGISIEQFCIRLPDPIKSIGRYTVPVRLHSEVSANLSVIVTEEKHAITKKDQKSKEVKPKKAEKSSSTAKDRSAKNRTGSSKTGKVKGGDTKGS